MKASSIAACSSLLSFQSNSARRLHAFRRVKATPAPPVWFVPSIATYLVCFALAFGSSARADCDPQFQQVNQDGFGDERNDYAWSMKTFGDRLYVGTLNRQGAQVWRYDGVDWEQVVDGGLTGSANRGVRNLVVFNGALYGGTLNQFGAEVWRSTDGVSWAPVMQGGFGDTQNASVRGMIVYGNQLYVGLFRGDGPGELWRSADGQSWEPVVLDGFGDPDNHGASAMEILDGVLYVGTSNPNGLQIWRSSDGLVFEPSVGPGAETPPGFGQSFNRNVLDLHTFGADMYVGTTARTLETGGLIGFEVYRTADGIHYERVASNGLGDFGNIYAWRLHTYEGAIWLGVFNVLNALFDLKGGSLWRSFDGTTWEEMVGRNGLLPYGFGDDKNWGVRSFETFQGKFYIGTANCRLERCQPGAMGTEIWEWPGESCPP